MSAAVPDEASRAIVQERVVDAPRDLVWKALTDPQHADGWWGPNGHRIHTSSMDVRAGGLWHSVVRSPHGKTSKAWMRFEEVTPGERVTYSQGGESEAVDLQGTILFEAQGDKTKVSLRAVYPSTERFRAAKKAGAVEGIAQTLARLAGYLPVLQGAIPKDAWVMTRLYDSPRMVVFDAWSSPKMLALWWGPQGHKLPVCELDFRTGGAYRMVMRDPQGQDYPVHGQYKDIIPNEKIVFEAVVDNAKGTTAQTQVIFVDEGRRTRLSIIQKMPEDKGLAEGQWEAWNGSLEKLEGILRELTPAV